MKRSMSERSPSGSSGASSRTSAGVERSERLNHFERESGGLGDFLRRRLATKLLAQSLRGAHDAGKVRGTVERHPHGPALAGQRSENCLADPPDRVGDELDALVRVELPRGGEESHVPFADQIGEREAAVLVFLGDRDDEAQVALHQLLHRLLVAGADQFRDGNFLLRGEERSLAHLEQVLVEDVLVGVVHAEGLRGFPFAAASLLGRRAGQNLWTSDRDTGLSGAGSVVALLLDFAVRGAGDFRLVIAS